MPISETIHFTDKIKYKGLNLLPIAEIKTNDYTVVCHFSKEMLDQSPGVFYPLIVKEENNLITLSEFVHENEESMMHLELNKTFSITMNANYQVDYHQILTKLYRFQYNKQKQILVLNIKQNSNILLSFSSVERPVFVRTKKIQKLLLGKCNDESGIITMDQSGRFIIQRSECKFPAIGIWLKCQSIQDAIVTTKICTFLRREVNKSFQKYMLLVNDKKYICFAKIVPNSMPELYLVSWKCEEGINDKECTMEYQIVEGNNTMVQLSHQNLQFTLRGKAESTSLKSSQFSSPKKGLSSIELEEQLQKLHLQQSPQFSSIKKAKQWSCWQEERLYLNNKVQSQQKQIQRLNREVERLTKQLINMRKCATSPQKPLNYLRSPTLINNSSTPAEKQKNLSQSDLEASNLKLKSFGTGCSGSTQEKKSVQNQQSLGSSSLEKNKKNVQIDQQPWDIMNFIECSFIQ